MNAAKQRLGGFTPLAGIAGLLVLWQIAVLVEVVDPVLLPTPAETFAAVWNGMVGGDMGTISCAPSNAPACRSSMPRCSPSRAH